MGKMCFLVLAKNWGENRYLPQESWSNDRIKIICRVFDENTLTQEIVEEATRIFIDIVEDKNVTNLKLFLKKFPTFKGNLNVMVYPSGEIKLDERAILKELTLDSKIKVKVIEFFEDFEEADYESYDLTITKVTVMEIEDFLWGGVY